METEKEERKKRDRNVANQITRENSCLLVCKIMKWRMLFDILGADWNFPCSKTSTGLVGHVPMIVTLYDWDLGD